MIGLTPNELALRAAAAGDEQARLIVATISVRDYLATHPGMPALGRPALNASFTMPRGDDACVDRLAQIAAWLGVEPVNEDGTYRAYRDFGGLSLGAHFTPGWVKEDRARHLLLGGKAAA